MNSKFLTDTALNTLDRIGYELDRLGITSKVNRHNLAALLMNEQKHFEGEWDSLQAKVGRRRSQLEAVTHKLEAQTNSLLGRFRKSA